MFKNDLDSVVECCARVKGYKLDLEVVSILCGNVTQFQYPKGPGKLFTVQGVMIVHSNRKVATVLGTQEKQIEVKCNEKIGRVHSNLRVF